MSRIFILGAGVVGSTTGRALAQAGHQVSFVEADPEPAAALLGEGLDVRSGIDLDAEPESFVFLCLPTSIDAEGTGYQLSAVEAGAEQVGKALATAQARHILVVRSTVPPGTTESLIRPLVELYSGKREGTGFALAVSPPFLRSGEGMTVIGARNRSVTRRLCDLLGPLGGRVRVFDDPATAELIHCADSLFNATKISFWNEIWQVCALLNLDPDQVAGTVAESAAGSIDPLFGIHGGAPYAGDRLPRETRGFLGFAAELGLPMPLLSAVVGVNTEFEWRLSSELDRVSGFSAIPRSRSELRTVKPAEAAGPAEVAGPPPPLPVRRRRPLLPRIPRQRLR